MWPFSKRSRSSPVDDESEGLQPSDLELVVAASSCRGFESLSDFKHAVKHTRLLRFGRTGRYLTPLSTQFKDEIKRLFSADKDVFEKADQMQKFVHRIVFWMRIGSVALFVAFLVQVLGALYWVSGRRSDIVEKLVSFPPSIRFFTTAVGPSLGLLVFVILWAVICSVLRIYVLRLISLNLVVSGQVKLFAASARTRYDAIDSKISNAIANSQVIGIPETDGTYKWPLRAKLETVVALWNAKRAEFLDRYSTLVFWKIRWFVSLAERIATLIKGAAAIGVVLFIWMHFGPTNGWNDNPTIGNTNIAPVAVLVAVTTIILITFSLGFFFLGRLPNDQWTRVLIKEIQDRMLGERHYFYRCGGATEDFVRRIMGPMRLQETGAPPTEDPRSNSK